MNEKIAVPSYWVLFIIVPTIIAGSVIIHFQYPKWVLAPFVLFLFWIGEHGVRWWAALICRDLEPKERE